MIRAFAISVIASIGAIIAAMTIKRIAIEDKNNETILVEAKEVKAERSDDLVKRSVNLGKAQLEIAQCDITKERTDAIVNAANSHLAHGGGVALAISKAGGHIINKESQEYVKEHGPVPTGGVAVTSAGNLQVRYVIHTVGPIWGEGDEDKKLRDAFYNSLVKADELELRSISFPAISSGIYGFPKDRCAEIFFKTVKEYLEENESKLELIRMCLYSKSDYEIFKKIMKEVFE